MRLVSIEMLKPDMVLARPVYQKDTLILKAGSRNISRYISNLLNMGIHYVYVEDGKSEGIEIPDVIAERTRHDCKQILRHTMEAFITEERANMQELTQSVDQILMEILQNKDVQVSLNDISAADEYTFEHSVSVAVYSLLVGRELGYNTSKMQKLAMGTLLHDIGKVLLDPDILYKKGKLTMDEFEYVKQHPLVGYQMLRRNCHLPEQVMQIAYEHHERLDGTGYPRKLTEKQIPEFSKIVAITDVYDALTTDRCYREKWPAHKAVDFIIERCGTEFSPELVQLFIQQIAIYPNGSLVRLSDGSVGLVKDQNKNMPLRPVVRVIQNSEGKEISPYEINMMKTLSITIVESELEITGSQHSNW